MDNHPLWLLKRIGFNTNPLLLRAGQNPVGRSNEENKIVCQSIWVSRNHCDIDVREEFVFIKDKGSFNGTYIEGFRIEKNRFVELKNGDFISLGKPFTKGEVISNDHYVFQIIACTAPNQNKSQLLPAKRKAALSPTREPLKRKRGTSPTNVSSTTSPKVPGSDDANVVDVVDLTAEDEPIIKEEIYSQYEDQRDIRTRHLQKPISPLHQNYTNTLSKRLSNESFISDMIPIASSSLINGGLDQGIGKNEGVAFPNLRNGGNEKKQEIGKAQGLQLIKTLLIHEFENEVESIDINNLKKDSLLNFFIKKVTSNIKTPNEITSKDCPLPSNSVQSVRDSDSASTFPNKSVENDKVIEEPPRENPEPKIDQMKNNNCDHLKIQDNSKSTNVIQPPKVNVDSRRISDPEALRKNIFNKSKEDSNSTEESLSVNVESEFDEDIRGRSSFSSIQDNELPSNSKTSPSHNIASDHLPASATSKSQDSFKANEISLIEVSNKKHETKVAEAETVKHLNVNKSEKSCDTSVNNQILSNEKQSALDTVDSASILSIASVLNDESIKSQTFLRKGEIIEATQITSDNSSSLNKEGILKTSSDASNILPQIKESINPVNVLPSNEKHLPEATTSHITIKDSQKLSIDESIAIASDNEAISKDCKATHQDLIDEFPKKDVNASKAVNNYDDKSLEHPIPVIEAPKAVPIKQEEELVITFPQLENTCSVPKKIIKKGKGIIIKGAKSKTGKVSVVTCKNPRKDKNLKKSLVSKDAEIIEMTSPNSSTEGFQGFNDSELVISSVISYETVLAEGKSDEHFLTSSSHFNTISEPLKSDQNSNEAEKEKLLLKEPESHNINSASNKNKNVSINSCKRIKRSNSSFDAQDVEKLLQDLEKSTEELENSEKSVKKILTIPNKLPLDCTENRAQKSSLVISKQLKKKLSSDNGLYKKIEKELRSVVGEPLVDDSSTQSSSGLLQNKPETKPEDVVEIIDLEDNNDQNNSFSQSGMNTVIEIDESDEVYSQIFSIDNQERNKCEEEDVKPFHVFPRIIKEEVDEFQEEDELELFESHFSQCSEEIEEYLEVENGQEFKENKDARKRKLDITEELDVSEDVVEKTTPSESSAQETSLPTIKVSSTSVPKAEVVVCPQTAPPEPKKPVKVSPPQTMSSPAEIKNDKQKSNIPKMEDLTGVKLVKSTLLSKPPEKEKKRGRKSKEEPSATKQAQIKRQQEKIKLERSVKLKNLALQNKPSENDSSENKNNSKLINNKENEKECKDNPVENSGSTRKVAKMTDRNRGTILLEGFLDAKPEPKKRGRPRKNAVIQDSLELIDKKENKKKVELPGNRQKSCLKSLNSISPVKKVEFNLNPMIRSYECEGTLARKVNSSVSKDKAPLRASVQHYIGINNNEILTDVLHWNASWRKESKIVKGDPPVHKEVFNTKDLFVSYTDYKRWLYPLLLYEIWTSMMKRMNEQEALDSIRNFDGVILSKDVKPHSKEKLLTLYCCAPLRNRNDISAFLDPSDILMFYMNTTGKKALMMYGIVGYHIKFCSARETVLPFARTYLSTLDYRPEYCAYFEVYIYNSSTRNVEVGTHIKLQPTYNMSTELKQYEGLLKLRTSPLLDTILDPEKNCTVFLSKDIDGKLISTYPLNAEQKETILCTSQIVFSNKPSISLVIGPPGTGKTRTIVGIVEQVLFRFRSKNAKKKRILICTQTNAAVDEICQRLLDVKQRLPKEKHFSLSRFGRVERTDPRLVDILTYSIAKTEVNKMNLDESFSLELSLLRAQEQMLANALESPKESERNNYKKKYELIQGNIRELERMVNNTATEEARRKQIEKLIRDVELKVIYNSDIVATTLNSCASRRLLKAFSLNSSTYEEKGEVGLCIVDEASQATDLGILLPLVHDIKNFILVGDPQQLPPMVNSETSKKNGLSRSLFSRLHKVWSGVDLGSRSPRDHLSVPVYTLKSQYRMHPEIAQFPSLAFYKNELISPVHLAVHRGFKPYSVITHKHLSDPDSPETNKTEAELVVNFVEEILYQIVFKGLSIGIIVPYQKQRAIISDKLHDKKLMRLITVNTIDSYQGQERDIIILTCVRTNGIGFLSDYQRTNVAITRAKRGLYIIGNFSSLQADPVWKSLFSNAQSRGLHLDLKSSTKGSEIIDFVVDEKLKQYRSVLDETSVVLAEQGAPRPTESHQSQCPETFSRRALPVRDSLISHLPASRLST